MATEERTTTSRAPGAGRVPALSRRRSTETKAAVKTTELIAYVAVLAAILIAGLVVDADGDGGVGFGPKSVWLYATLLTIGYMISRGLAKSGSRDPYTEQTPADAGEGLTERLGAAAAVLRGDQPAAQGGAHVGGDAGMAPEPRPGAER